MFKNTEQAINTIKMTVHSNSKKYLPYFFIVGAGISVPEIPSAKQIIDMCKNEVKKLDLELFADYEKKTAAFSDNTMKYYSAWIEYAYPNPIDRSELFKRLNSKSKISSANLILAQILSSRKIANTVFTTNFDDSLKRALDLIGTRNFFSSENSMDNLVINTHTDDIQIVHVHGTYNFYDCANLEHEINCVAEQSGIISSSRLLSNFLTDRAPIIVGYSGWENDVIMTCLKERLLYPTPFHYFWICYDQKSYDNLPDWIKNSEKIIFVLPFAENTNCDRTSNFIEKRIDSSVIDAAKFFRNIVHALKIESPLIFSNPYSYYAKQFDTLLPKNEDVLHLKHFAERLKSFDNNDSDFKQSIKKLEEAFIKKDFVKGKEVILDLCECELSTTDIEFVCNCIIKEYIEDEDVISSFQERIDFHIASITFIKNNLDKIQKTGDLIDSLRLLMYTKFETSNATSMIELFDMVSNIASQDSRLLIVELASLGMKSSLLPKNERKELLESIVSRCPIDSDDTQLSYIKLRALMDLCDCVNVDIALQYINTAENLIDKLKVEHFKVQLLTLKSELLKDVQDQTIRSKWKDEIFKAIKSPKRSVKSAHYISLISNLSLLSVEELGKSFKIELLRKHIAQYIDDYEPNTTNCNLTLEFATSCELLARLCTENTDKAKYYKKILLLQSSFPHVCNNFSRVLLETYFTYLQLPEDIVSYVEKEDFLKKTKGNSNTYSVFMELLPFIAELDFVKNNNLFQEEQLIYQNSIKQLSDGYNLYLKREYFKAEQIFLELLSNPILTIASTAKTNLCFMIRREETENEYSFWDMLYKTPSTNELDLVNIVLYCNKNGLLEDERYKLAMQEINDFSEKDIQKVLNCWENIDLVGEYENEFVLALITKRSQPVKV